MGNWESLLRYFNVVQEFSSKLPSVELKWQLFLLLDRCSFWVMGDFICSACGCQFVDEKIDFNEDG